MAINISLIKQAVVAKSANQRQSSAHTKTRGEVSGGGKKPWKQKGTGRARAGSSRSPIWVGGGITFGPRSKRNFKKTLPKKMSEAAKTQLWQLLKDENRVIRAEKLTIKEPKTKLAVKLLEELGAKPTHTLFVTETTRPELILGTANLPNVDVVVFSHVSLLDLVNYKTVAMEATCYDSIFGAPKAAKKETTVAKKPVAKKKTS